MKAKPQSLFWLMLAASVAAAPVEQALYQQTQAGYYRIPSITVTSRGTVLAFAQHRKGARGDFGHESDVVMRRSTNGGKTFEAERVLATRANTDIHTGPVVIDQRAGRILKFFRYWPVVADADPKAAASKSQALVDSTPYQRMVKQGFSDYLITSDDDGKTWSAAQPLVLPYPPEATRFGAGNGVHGVQLASGRLLIQGGYSLPQPVGEERFMCVFYSDDGGKSWQRGATAPNSSVREFTLAPLADGTIYYNARTKGAANRRVAWSRDEGLSFGDIKEDQALKDRDSHAGLVLLPNAGPQGTLLFTLPAAKRKGLVFWLSTDGGRTWPVSRTLDNPSAGYSDLAADAHGNIHCLYEALNPDGKKLRQIRYAQVTLGWISGK